MNKIKSILFTFIKSSAQVLYDYEKEKMGRSFPQVLMGKRKWARNFLFLFLSVKSKKC